MTENLLVIWQDVNSRQKYQIGTLNYNRQEEVYSFTYAFDVTRRGLQEALNAGFKGIYEFELKSETITSKELFHFFNKRLPNPKRSDYNDLLSYLGLNENASKMDFLKRTKGRLGTDSYELISPIVKDNRDNSFNLEGFIEGWQYYEGEKVWDQLNIGDRLKLMREPENEIDKFAVKILTLGNVHLGYVAAVYSEFISEVLDNKNECNIQIFEKYPNAIPQMKVCIGIDGKCSFRPNEFSNDHLGYNERELVLI